MASAIGITRPGSTQPSAAGLATLAAAGIVMSQEGIVELGKIYKSVSINEFHVKREDNGYLVSFTFTHEDGEVSVKLSGVRDSASIIELLEAERVWAEKSGGSQLEFGGLTLGISHEYFTEVTFDAFAG